MLCILVLMGCQKESRARVECQVAGNDVSCTVSHVQGNVPLNVCWDVEFACRSGAHVTGHACQDVDPQGRSVKLITSGELQGLASCDGATSFNVRNIVLTRREGSASASVAMPAIGGNFMTVAQWCSGFCGNYCGTCLPGVAVCPGNCAVACYHGRNPGLILDGRDPVNARAKTPADMAACNAAVNQAGCQAMAVGPPLICQSRQY